MNKIFFTGPVPYLILHVPKQNGFYINHNDFKYYPSQTIADGVWQSVFRLSGDFTKVCDVYYLKL